MLLLSSMREGLSTRTWHIGSDRCCLLNSDDRFRGVAPWNVEIARIRGRRRPGLTNWGQIVPVREGLLIFGLVRTELGVERLVSVRRADLAR
jgi:hypothetical protein